MFGLGNRQYEHYNAMGKVTNERLEAAGATRVYRHGEGDDDGNLEEDFDSWRSDGLWDAMAAAAPPHPHHSHTASAAAGGGGPLSPIRSAAAWTGATGAPSAGTNGHASPLPGARSPLLRAASVARFPWRLVPVPPPSSAQAAPGACVPLFHPSPAHLAAAAAADMTSRHFFTAVPAAVVVNRELRQAPSVGASTRHVELDLAGTGLTYRTADNAHVLPENDPSVVDAVARWLGYKPEEWFTLEAVEGGDSDTGGEGEPPAPLFPTPTNVRTALTRYVDLSGMPRKELLSALAPYAKAADDRKRMLHLSSREGKAEWAEWAVAAERSTAEVFSEFPSLAPPLEAFLQLAPRMQPRAYTIASSSVVAPTRMALCASVLDAPKPGPDGRRRLRGVCSNTFQRLAAGGGEAGGGAAAPRGGAGAVSLAAGGASPGGGVLRVLIRPSTFHLPEDVTRPVILVGPGTGVAPMRAFCQEREAQRGTHGPGGVGPTLLFFGCRKRAEDYVYRDEIGAWAANGTLTALHVAFSRDTGQKVGEGGVRGGGRCARGERGDVLRRC